jgi:hypothetical protein
MSRDATQVPLAVAVVAALVYGNALANGFVLDDRGIILQNPLVQHPSTSWRAFVSPYWPASVGAGQYRPLGIISFALDHAIAGNTPGWFHAVNVAWHAAATALLAWLGCLLAGGGVGLVAGLIFAVHPVHVEAVANVVGRLELMATTFALATLILHRRRSPVAVVMFAAALGSKEGAAVVPLLALLIDRIPGGPDVSARRLFLAYGGVLVVWGGAMSYALRGSPLSTTSAVFVDLSSGERLLTVLAIVPHYARLLFWPAQLSADYEPGVLSATRSLTPEVALGVLLLVMIGLGLRAAWQRSPVLAGGIVWTALAIGPVSNVLVVTGVALAERTLYLASAGVALGVGWLVNHAGAHALLGRAAIGVLLLAGVARTWTRTPTWRDSRSFALQLLEDHPESYRGHWVAGRVLRGVGDLPAAAREFAVARSIYQGDATLLRESAEVAVALGASADAARLSAAADSLVVERAR